MNATTQEFRQARHARIYYQRYWYTEALRSIDTWLATVHGIIIEVLT